MFKEGRNIMLAGLVASGAACTEAPRQTDRILRMEIESLCKPGNEFEDGRMIADELRPLREVGYTIPGGYGFDSELVRGLADSYRDCTPADFQEARAIQLEESSDTRYVDFEILDTVRDAVTAGFGKPYREINLDENRED